MTLLLFNNIQAAREVAYVLRGEYDGYNGVVLDGEVDTSAIPQASALIELELGEKIKYYCSGSSCPLSWGLLDNHGALQPIPDYYLLDTSVEMADCISQEIESDPQVLDLFAQLEPGTLFLNTCEYSLSPGMEAAFWRISWQGRGERNLAWDF